MKTREMLMVFALTSTLTVAVASTPQTSHRTVADMSIPSMSTLLVRTHGSAFGLQEQPAPVQPAPEQKDVDVTVKTQTTEWYVSPVWIAIGILAAVVLVLLIAMAVRGGGNSETTRIIHERP